MLVQVIAMTCRGFFSFLYCMMKGESAASPITATPACPQPQRTSPGTLSTSAPFIFCSTAQVCSAGGTLLIVPQALTLTSHNANAVLVINRQPLASKHYKIYCAVWWHAEHEFEPGSQQHTFIEIDLKSVDRTKTPWVVVGGHRPVGDIGNENLICN